jgi:hypothetical protein
MLLGLLIQFQQSDVRVTPYRCTVHAHLLYQRNGQGV